jgi:tetratricopeptide (TPR) repeat protein
MKKKLVYSGILVIILLVIFAWFYFKNNSNIGNVDWTNSEVVFNIAIPEDFEAHQIERLQEKIATAKKAYTEEPDDNYTWVIVADAYKFARDYERAILAYEKSLVMQPDDVISVINLGTIYEKYQIDYNKAEEYYSRAISIFPQMPDLYDRLAKLYWQRMDRIEDAETIYLQGLEATDQNSEVYKKLIVFYEIFEERVKLKFYVQEYLELYPEDTTVKQEWGYLLE